MQTCDAGWILSGFAVVIGVGCLYGGYQAESARTAAESWRATPGKVISRGLERVSGIHDAHAPSEDDYGLTAAFEYVVGGKTYRSDPLYLVSAPRPTFQHEAPPKSALAALPEQVTVHYDPTSRANAAIHLGEKSQPWIVLGSGLALVLARLTGILWMIFAHR